MLIFFSSGFPAGLRNHLSSLPRMCSPVKARLHFCCVFFIPGLFCLMSVLCEHTSCLDSCQWLFVCVRCVLQLQRWGFQVRHKRKNLSLHLVTLSQFLMPYSIFVPLPLFHILFKAHICLCISSITSQPSAAPLSNFLVVCSSTQSLSACLSSFSPFIWFLPLFLTSIIPYLPPSTLALQMNSEEEIALPASAVISWSD